MSKNTSKTNKNQNSKNQANNIGLFDILNQALSEFVHTEHIEKYSFVELVDQCIVNKKQNPGAIDPLIFAFSPSSDPPADLLVKFCEHLRARYIKNLATFFTSKPTEFWRFHAFMSNQAIKSPDIFPFLSDLATATSENDPQTLALLFNKYAFPLYSQFLSKSELLSQIIILIFANTESDESSRDTRVQQILDCINDDEARYIVLAHTVQQERIFSSKLCDLYASFVEKGLDNFDFQPYAVHILRFLIPINSELLQKHIEKITKLTDDERPVVQAALVQLLVDTNQEQLITHLLDKISRLDVLTLALHLISELGQISAPLLITLFKKIGAQNIEQVCTERCSVETPVGSLQLGRLTNTWNSAAVNATVIEHVQALPLSSWDVEFALCKLLLKQPMDSTSAQIWKRLFAELSPQFGELMRDEETTEVVFDIVGFYIFATQDIDFLEKLQPALEPVVTVAKEKCKNAATKFLSKVADLGPRFKQVASLLILIE